MLDLFQNNEEIKGFITGVSADSMREFTRSRIWQTLKCELQAWLIDSWESLENPEDENFQLLQGRIRAIREMLELPEALAYRIENETIQDSD